MTWNSLIPRGTDCTLAAVLYTYSLFFMQTQRQIWYLLQWHYMRELEIKNRHGRYLRLITLCDYSWTKFCNVSVGLCCCSRNRLYVSLLLMKCHPFLTFPHGPEHLGNAISSSIHNSAPTVAFWRYFVCSFFLNKSQYISCWSVLAFLLQRW